MKKLFLNLGASIAIAAPIISLISCGTGKLEDLKGKDLNKTKSTIDWTTMSRPIVNESTMFKPIIDWSTMTNPIIDESKVGNAIIDESRIGSSIIDQSKVGNSIIDELKVKNSIIDESKIGSSIIDQSNIYNSIIDESLVDTMAVSEKQTSVYNVVKLINSPDPLTNFIVSEESEDPHIDGYLKDVTHDLRDFRIYDNGLYKIKIDKALIGPNKFYKNNDKADFQATDIANSINIGPAITDLPKGIQLLDSDSLASLGGEDGVQITMGNKFGSIDDIGIKCQTSLVCHEYGHHETRWDFRFILGGRIPEENRKLGKLFKNVVVDGLRDSGYGQISTLVKSSNPSKENWDVIYGVDRDFPTDYGKLSFGNRWVFKDYDYSLNPSETTTRLLNILSFRTSINPLNIYKFGGCGSFEDGHEQVLPTALMSDLTVRHLTGDSVFGDGKDSSRVNKLINFYMDDIFGDGRGSIKVMGNSAQGTFSGIDLEDFNCINNLDKLEVVNSHGEVVAWTKPHSFNSRFGFKNELFSNNWSTKINDKVSYINNFYFNIKDARKQTYRIIGRDFSNNEVDLSKLTIRNMTNKDSSLYYPDYQAISHEGKHFVLNWRN